jgi:phage-related protein (TIGR01555 family)
MTDYRTDDWASTTGALGGIRDKHTSLYFAARPRLPRARLTTLYTEDPIVARCCDQMADDCFRTPWEFDEWDADDITAKDAMGLIEPYGIEGVLGQTFRWGALYGLGAATIQVQGCGAPHTPLVARPRSPLYKSKVLVADDCQPYEVDTGWGSESYGDVLSYQVMGLAGSSSLIKVHASRLLVYEPIPLPMLERRSSANGCGPSIVERLFNALGKDGAASSHAIAMMYIASLLYVKLKGYKDAAKTDDGRNKIRDMLALTRQQLDSLGLLGLDADDEIGNLTLAVTGAHELMDRMRDRLAAASPMPREILFKESPTGLRGGELTGPQALWYGAVDSFRRDVAAPLLSQWLRVAFACLGVTVRKWTIKWAPLWMPTQAELAANQLTLAQADQIRIESGPLSPTEVRDHRFVKGSVEPVRIEPTAPAAALALPTPEDMAAEAGGAPADVAAEAMNGAQVDKLVAIAEKVKAGLLDRDAALALVQAAYPGVAVALAERIVGPVPDPNAAPEDAAFADGDMVKVQRAAELLGVHTTSVMNEIAKAGPERVRVRGVGGQRVVSIRDLRAWLDRDGDGEPDPELVGEEGGDEPAPEGAA